MGNFNVEGIRKVVGNSFLAFVLADAALFLGTGFKMLKNQDDGSFVPCVKSEYNGRVKLTYFTGGFTALGDYANAADEQACHAVLCGLVAACRRLGENGFLSLRNVPFEEDTVFVEPGTGAVALVYLPVSISVSGQTDLQAIRALYELCARMQPASSGSVESLGGLLFTEGYEAGDLNALTTYLDDMHAIPVSRPRMVAPPSPSVSVVSSTESSRKETSNRVEVSLPREDGGTVKPLARKTSPNRGHVLVAYNLLPVGERGTLTFHIVQERTVIGKHSGKVDCVITTSPAVSRVHCELTIGGDGRLSVSDLGSKNGTYVDGRRLARGEQAFLEPGVRLRVADVEFVVQRAG